MVNIDVLLFKNTGGNAHGTEVDLLTERAQYFFAGMTGDNLYLNGVFFFDHTDEEMDEFLERVKATPLTYETNENWESSEKTA